MSFLIRIQLFAVRAVIWWLNFILGVFRRLLFSKSVKNPLNIVIYKTGHIGDVVCAVPALIAVRRAYPDAKITMLTSPGMKGMPGAKELLSGAWYLDELIVYYSEDIASLKGKADFLKNLKDRHFDLFIQLPEDLASFRNLLRNMFFAKAFGMKSAFGFRVRTIQIFKKVQVDNLFYEAEAKSLLGVLRENGIISPTVTFDFNISIESQEKISALLKEKWGSGHGKNLVVVINPGGKREANQWPEERFGEVARYLQEKYRAKIIITGGKTDVGKAEIIKRGLKENDVLIAAGAISLLETIELFKHCSLLVSNDTGAVHMASATGLPVVGIYCIRNVFGRWFPIGVRHRIVCHKFFDCDYRTEECIKESTDIVSVGEVKNACDELIEEIK